MPLPDDAAHLQNRLLAALPAAELAQLAGQLELCELERRQVLYLPDQPINTVYFPLSGLVSLVTFADTGTRQTAVEVATIGQEGMVGVAILPEANRMPFRAFCQIPGPAYRLPVSVLDQQEARLPALRRLLWRYTQAIVAQIAQTAACNLLHSVEMRCTRWLLTAYDRVGNSQFRLTHEFLAEMLGTRRGTVTAAVRRLADAGLIEYRWGQMQVVNRAELETAGCSCYRRIRQEYNRLLPED